MIRSILIKSGMLILATGAVLVLGWPWAEHQRNNQLFSRDEIDESQGGTGIEKGQSANGSDERSQVVRNQTASDVAPASAVQIESLLDINESTAEELEALPGVGLVLAGRIIERRTSVGKFQSPEDLMDVKGLGPKRIDQLRPLIRFDSVPKR